MDYFSWNDGFSTSIEIIDEQHKRLVQIVNELHSAMKKGKGKEIIDGTLADLLEYTKYHFSTEEQAFDEYGYPATSEHKGQHAGLIASLNEQLGKRKANDISVTVNTLEFLSQWIKNHILVEDMKYVPFLTGKRIG